LACIRELKLDGDRVNPHGGAIAVGHPIGASGARIVTHLSHVLDGASGDGCGPRAALATLCVGGGMGCAIAMEAVR
jgi:acetyl-CoA C-acetyltransferase